MQIGTGAILGANLVHSESIVWIRLNTHEQLESLRAAYLLDDVVDVYS